MDVQWWIDSAGKIGSASVAAAVFIAALAQNRWVNRVARRSADVEDQKVRLQLLERRISVLNEYDEVRADWGMTGEVRLETISKLQRVIVSAELIFPSELPQLEQCRAHLSRMRQLDRALDRRIMDDDARAQAIDAAVEQDGILGNAMDALRKTLVEAAQVKPVKALPPSFLDRVLGRIAR
ncbi:hypothetical protein [Sphingomonas paucimobilis]|uniref:hypothetical protein n=1 Tax=Sphingomonas paucimobilis TaxID=13689 RepID=UPI0030F5B6A2